jgi:UPF0755 protein
MWKFFRFITLLIILAFVAGGGFAYWVNRTMHTPIQHNSASELIEIEQGMGRRAIVNRLVERGIIAERVPVLAYLAVRPDVSKMQAGEYRFESPITPLSVLEKLNRGLVATEQITIPEGYDRFDVVNVLTAANIDTREAIENAVRDTSLIADIDPEAQNLEGYLFPDTYVYTTQMKAPQLIVAMVRKARRVLTPERQNRAREMGFSMRQIITMASLIEREAKVNEERPLIAGVFYNRLKHNMMLGCDPTFIYAAKLSGDWDNNVNNPAHKRRESPYNTYVYAGLPPGPIASPGMRSIDAALNPAETDFVYFVVTGTDGRHKFSKTEAEHLAAVAAYHRQQRQSQGN